MKIDILIPTCKDEIELVPMITDLEGFAQGNRIITTHLKESASVNRNKALNDSDADLIIMMDDDVSGFYDGWVDDLVAPLADPDIMIVSARLVNTDGMPAAMMFVGDTTTDLAYVPRVPTAAIAFRKTDIRFDEGFIGSGYEDDWFMLCMQSNNPTGRIVINNGCRLVHANEMKNQHNKYAEHNSKHFAGLVRKHGLAELRERPALTPFQIPRIIHFVWIGSEKPLWVENNIAEFKRLNSGYSVMIHGEEILDKKFRQHYDTIKHAEHEYSMKADLLRLSAIEKFGGWYWDCDFWPLAPIDDILRQYPTDKMILFSSADRKIVCNGMFGSRKNDPGLKHIIDEVLSHYCLKPEWWDYGTWCFWSAFHKKPDLYTIIDSSKCIPVSGKNDALRYYKDPDSLARLKDSGHYALHMEMQDSKDIYEYHSEHGQDKWLNENIFKNKKYGIFVEVGAIDGLITSNSLFFERDLGWTG